MKRRIIERAAGLAISVRTPKCIIHEARLHERLITAAKALRCQLLIPRPGYVESNEPRVVSIITGDKQRYNKAVGLRRAR